MRCFVPSMSITIYTPRRSERERELRLDNAFHSTHCRVMSSLRDHILSLVQAYALQSGRSTARVSTLALGSGAKYARLLEGTSDVTTSKYEAVLRWFSAHWPPDLEWPADIPRPPLPILEASP